MDLGGVGQKVHPLVLEGERDSSLLRGLGSRSPVTKPGVLPSAASNFSLLEEESFIAAGVADFEQEVCKATYNRHHEESLMDDDITSALLKDINNNN